MDKLERRSVTLKELRIEEGGESQTDIVGYASVFDSWSEEMGGSFPFREKVCQGAFADTIAGDDIRALFNHDANYVLGRNKAGTLTLEEDEKGLLVKITPPETQWAKDLLVSIKRGDITQMSFGFSVILDRWSYEEAADVRELLKVKLFDVSPVTYPAYTQTECTVRTAADVYKERKEAQEAEHRKREETEKRKTNELQKRMKKFELLKENHDES